MLFFFFNLAKESDFKFSNCNVVNESLDLTCSAVNNTSINPIKSVFSIYDYPAKNPSSKPFSSLEISRSDFLLKVLVPYLQGLHWLSKKKLDFADWAAIIALKTDGKHLIPECRELISDIISQMNNSRLSTFSNNTTVDLSKKIALFKAMPSNYKFMEDGKVLDIYSGNIIQSRSSKGVALIDENGKISFTFDSGNACAEFLGIGRTSVYSKIKTGRSVIFNNKTYFLKYI